MRIHKAVCAFIDNLLRTKRAEEKVATIKDDADRKIKKATNALHKSGELQTKILERTTTYYIGRAAGIIK